MRRGGWARGARRQCVVSGAALSAAAAGGAKLLGWAGPALLAARAAHAIHDQPTCVLGLQATPGVVSSRAKPGKPSLRKRRVRCPPCDLNAAATEKLSAGLLQLAARCLKPPAPIARRRGAFAALGCLVEHRATYFCTGLGWKTPEFAWPSHLSQHWDTGPRRVHAATAAGCDAGRYLS